MARGADGSLLTKEQLKEENIRRFNEAIASGNLYNTGPITGEGGTSFSKNRWDEYFKENEDVKPKGYTTQEKIQEKMDAGEDVAKDLFGYEPLETPESFPMGVERDGERTYEFMGKEFDEWGNLVEEKPEPSAQSSETRGKTGDRDKDGNLKSKSMKEELAADIAREKEIEADFVNENEFDTSVQGWRKQLFGDMSDDDFFKFKEESLAPLKSVNALDAYMEEYNARTASKLKAEQAEAKAKEAAEAKKAADAAAEAERQKMFAPADFEMDEFDARIQAALDGREFDWQGQAKGPMTDEERSAAVYKDKQEFPYMNMSDEEKGDFTFKKTAKPEGVDVLMKDAGLDEEAATKLFSKLKGLCG